MTSAWVENGPVSLPPRPVAYGAGIAVLLLAALGVGLGFHAGWRDGAAPSTADGAATRAAMDSGVITARPVVEFAPPVAPTPKAEEVDPAKAAEQAAAAAKAKELAAQQAAAQALQSKTAHPEGNIDDILTSASEKPVVPPKPVEETPKTDVPF